MTRSPELDRILGQEIERRVGVEGTPAPSSEELRLVLHSLKGSASMAGHPDLALVVAQLDSRFKSGEPAADDEAVALLRAAAAQLGQGLSPFEAHWPEPPEGLRPSVVESSLRGDYLALMSDRLAEVDAAVQLEGDSVQRLSQVYRSVHSMKAAATGVGDDTTAWYCHGLESRLRKVLNSGEGSDEAMAEVVRHRATLARLLEDPLEAFAMLHQLGSNRGVTTSRRPPGLPARTTIAPGRDEADVDAETSLKIPGHVLEHLFDHLERLELGADQLHASTETARRLTSILRETRAVVTELSRTLGPSHSWGASATTLRRLDSTLRLLSDGIHDSERLGGDCRQLGDLLRGQWSELRGELGTLRRTTLGSLFERLSGAVARFAEREGKQVQVTTDGDELTIDRPLAERLFEPLMQLARNAIGHGISSPTERLLEGKPAVGSLYLSAERHGDWLRLVVEDDGQGVDVERVRQAAIERGALESASARRLTEFELFALLFVPGLSTRRGADYLAGRGVGLDLAQDVVRRLGGSIRLERRRGGGVRATLEVPSERGLLDVAWLEAAGRRFAIPVSALGRVELSRHRAPTVSLASAVGLESRVAPVLTLEVVVPGVQALALGIDALGDAEEVAVRPLPPLLATVGPFAGVVVRGDGSLCLVLDSTLLTAQAWSAVH